MNNTLYKPPYIVKSLIVVLLLFYNYDLAIVSLSSVGYLSVCTYTCHPFATLLAICGNKEITLYGRLLFIDAS